MNGQIAAVTSMSIHAKVYNRTMATTENQQRDEQGGFKRGGGCVDLVFSLIIVSGKYLKKNKAIIVSFTYLEEVYDGVHRGGVSIIEKTRCTLSTGGV